MTPRGKANHDRPGAYPGTLWRWTLLIESVIFQPKQSLSYMTAYAPERKRRCLANQREAMTQIRLCICGHVLCRKYYIYSLAHLMSSEQVWSENKVLLPSLFWIPGFTASDWLCGCRQISSHRPKKTKVTSSLFPNKVITLHDRIHKTQNSLQEKTWRKPRHYENTPM